MESHILHQKNYSCIKGSVASENFHQAFTNGNGCDMNDNTKLCHVRQAQSDIMKEELITKGDADRHSLSQTSLVLNDNEKNTITSIIHSDACDTNEYKNNGLTSKDHNRSHILNKQFLRREIMNINSVIHTGENLSSQGSVHVNSNEYNTDENNCHIEKESFKCENCCKSFGKKEDMEIHCLLSHTSDNSDNLLNDRSNACNIDKEIENAHKDEKKSSYTCDICHKSFLSTCSNDMKRHYLSHACENPSFQSSDSSNRCNINEIKWISKKESKCYTCDVCQKSWIRKEDFDRHYLTHTGQRPYRCDFCHKSYVRVTILKHHMLRHIGEPTNPCRQCGKEFMLASHLQRHMVFHSDPRPHKCPSCGKGFQTPTGVNKHMSVHTGKKTYVTCDICDKKFSCRANAFRHKVNVHFKKEIKKEEVVADTEKSTMLNNSERNETRGSVGDGNVDNFFDKLPTLPFVCEICGKAYTHKSFLKRHMVVHSADNPLTCKRCHKQFIYQSNLTEHMLIHSSEGRHTCKVCNRVFDAACKLRYHMNTHTAETVFKCHICFKQYMIEGSLRSHMKWKHPDKCLVCNICGQNYANEQSLKSHMVSHSTYRPFKCELCPKSFKRKSSLDDHIKRHSGVKLFNCNVCNKSFVTQSNCNNHMKTHSDLKLYSCTLCDKSYKGKYHLQQHMHVHTDTKPHVCDLCGLSFRLHSSLRRHEMRHSGKMPFKCETCGKLFRYKPNLREHQYVHTGEPMPFKCEVTGCNKTFFTRSKLDIHTSTHLGNRLFDCHLCGQQFRHKHYFRYHLLRHLGEETAVYECDLCGKKFSRPFILKEHIKTHLRYRKKQIRPAI